MPKRKNRPNKAAAALRAMGTREGAQRAARARWAGVPEDERRVLALKAITTRWAKKKKKKK
jgi:hypothetical protein